MPHAPRPRHAVLAVILWSGGWSQASAQMAAATMPAPPPQSPSSSMLDIADRLLDQSKQEAEGTWPGQGQQSWRITKGKDYDKLPAEFQWDAPPIPINTPHPVYPYELLRANVAGKVRAFFIIGPEGRVIKAELDGAVAPEFGLAIRAMLDRCRFNPARKKDGTPAYAYVGIEYDFEPKGRSDAPVGEQGRMILRDLATKPGSIVGLRDLDQPLRPLSRPPPVYPTALQKERPAGDTEVEFFVDLGGRVQLPHIKACSAPEFGYAAVQAVAAWRFEAPKRGGKTVVVRATVPIGFEGRKAPAAPKP